MTDLHLSIATDSRAFNRLGFNSRGQRQRNEIECQKWIEPATPEFVKPHTALAEKKVGKRGNGIIEISSQKIEKFASAYP